MGCMKLFACISAAATMTAIAAPAHAAAFDGRQDLSQLQRVVESYVRKESAGLPGKVSFSVAAFDARLALPPCPSPEAFLPAGARLWGKSTVAVRCTAGAAWTVYASVQIEVHAEYVVTARPIAQGEPVKLQDLAVMNGDLAKLPAGIVIDPAQAVGKQFALSVGAGQPVRQDMLRSPNVVVQGQGVRLVSEGPGFRVSTEGKALANAADGQSVQVRSPSGQTVSGIARAGGVVEVRF
jgi:flagella basal body P-ring formation protein FlgA